MNKSIKTFKRLFLAYIIIWTLAFFLFSILRGIGTESSGLVQISLTEGFLLSSLVGPLCGILAAINQNYFEGLINLRSISLQKLIQLKLLSSLFLILCITVLTYFILVLIKPSEISLLSFILQIESLVVYLYIFIIDTVISLARRISLIIGEERVWKLISGSYYSPKSETKLFLFIDLRGSTKIAELIGHLKYSKLLQATFNDVALIEQFGGDIYQYIGDEIVFTWDDLSVQSTSNAINGFLHFQEKMAEYSNYYKEEFGITPTFKAGLHGGQVTTVEIGLNKKEIAYHGDTINTASRIQESCNEFNQTFIVSEDIVQILEAENQFKFSAISEILLKGKSSKTKLFSVIKDELSAVTEEISIREGFEIQNTI